MNGTVYNQANAIVKNLCNDMTVQHENLIQAKHENLIQAMVQLGTSNKTVTEPPPPAPVVNSVNAVTTDVPQLAILDALKQLQETITKTKRNDGSRNICLRHYCSRKVQPQVQ